MAYKLTIDKAYAEASTYRGSADCFVADLKGPPEQITFGIVDDIIVKVVEWFPRGGADKLIRIRIWENKAPTWATLYRVEVIAHGSPIPWALIAAVLAGLALIALTAWFVTQIDWGEMLPPPVQWGFLLLAAAAVVYVATRPTKPKVKEKVPT